MLLAGGDERPDQTQFTLAGHRTSIALEPEFWDALGRLAQRRGLSLSALIAEADAARGPEFSACVGAAGDVASVGGRGALVELGVRSPRHGRA